MASRVSWIIPTYKEDDLPAALSRLTAHLLVSEAGAQAAAARYEIIVVDDSPEPYRDGIRAYIDAASARLSPRVEIRLLLGPGTGKGGAIRAGARASRGDFVFTIDADLPIPLEHVERFLEVLERTRCDVVIGERPFDRNLSEPVRFVLSRGLFAFQRVLVLLSREFVDTQCGFKAFRGDDHPIDRFASNRGRGDVRHRISLRGEARRGADRARRGDPERRDAPVQGQGVEVHLHRSGGSPPGEGGGDLGRLPEGRDVNLGSIAAQTTRLPRFQFLAADKAHGKDAVWRS